MTDIEQPTNALFNFDDGAPDHKRLRAHSADFTPRGVVDQFVEGIESNADAEELQVPRRILDPAAGGGVFGQSLRAMLKRNGVTNTTITGVELREEEEPNLQRHYDEVIIGDALQYARSAEPFDLIITNPPFGLWREYLAAYRHLLTADGGLVLLGLCTWGQRAKASVEMYEQRQYQPLGLKRITGTIGFRGPGVNPETGKRWGTDTRSYGWWCWGPNAPTMKGWLTSNLPLLDSTGRRWRVKPGYEPG